MKKMLAGFLTLALALTAFIALPAAALASDQVYPDEGRYRLVGANGNGYRQQMYRNADEDWSRQLEWRDRGDSWTLVKSGSAYSIRLAADPDYFIQANTGCTSFFIQKDDPDLWVKTFVFYRESGSDPYDNLTIRPAGHTDYKFNRHNAAVGPDYVNGVDDDDTNNKLWALLPVTCSVFYNDNGGLGGPHLQTVQMDGVWTVPDAEPVREHYAFLGWSGSSRASQPDFLPGQSVKENPTDQEGGTVTLYAVWQSNDVAATAEPPVFTDVQPADWHYAAVNWAVEQGLMEGMGDGTFAPDAPLTRAMLVTMLWRQAGRPSVAAAAAFTDLPAGAWFEAAVQWAAAQGVVAGVDAATFAPDAPVTREQLAAILYRYAQAQGRGFSGLWSFPLDFPDAAAVSAYAYEPMCWMTMQQIIQGMADGTLAPQGAATRAEIAAVMMRFNAALAQ